MSNVSGGEKADRYLADLAKRLGEGKVLRVGFLEGATYPDGTPVAMIAAVQNFGSAARGIPPRPFFTNMVRDKAAGWGDALVKCLEASNGDMYRALQLMGEGISGQLRESIVSGEYEPNAPVTNLLKQRFPMGGQTFADVLQARHDVAAGATAPPGKPLVQSGDMLNAVGYEVTVDGVRGVAS